MHARHATSIQAVTAGTPHLLQWAFDQSCPRTWHCTEAAAKTGQPGSAAVRSAERLCLELCWPPVELNACCVAARGGHLKVVQWAHAHGCNFHGVVVAAAVKGHLHIVRWAHAQGMPVNDDHSIAVDLRRTAASLRRFSGCLRKAAQLVSSRAPKLLPVVIWTSYSGFAPMACLGVRLHAPTQLEAVIYSFLQWARDNGAPWNEYVCIRAAEGGHLQLPQWARANGAPWCEETCAKAARGGHLQLLQWVRANGCGWSDRTCHEAAKHGHLHILQRARANSAPWNEPSASERPQKAICTSCNGLVPTARHGT